MEKIKKPLIQTLFNQASFPNLGLNDSINYKGSNYFINLLNQYLIKNAPTNVTLIDLEFISKIQHNIIFQLQIRFID